MKVSAALVCLSALAQETRLAVFRMLVTAGREGIPAGGIARRLGVPPATLSFHLKELQACGLLVSRRRSRQILYAVDDFRANALLMFLATDCCAGRPEICRALADQLAAQARRAAPGGRGRSAARRRDAGQSQSGGTSPAVPGQRRAVSALAERGER